MHRVFLLANSNLVPAYANWETFHELDKKGLMMYGQMTAGSWIYIGTQGIVQGTYETFAECAKQHFNGSLKRNDYGNSWIRRHGRRTTTCRYDGRRRCIGIDVDRTRIEKRIETRYCDTCRQKA